jgi:hypothetical protein
MRSLIKRYVALWQNQVVDTTIAILASSTYMNRK